MTDIDTEQSQYDEYECKVFNKSDPGYLSLGPLKYLDLRMHPILEMDFSKQRQALMSEGEKDIEIARNMKDEEIKAKLREQQIKRGQDQARQKARVLEIYGPMTPDADGSQNVAEVAVARERDVEEEAEFEENSEAEREEQADLMEVTERLESMGRKGRKSASKKRAMTYKGGVEAIDISDASSDEEEEEEEEEENHKMEVEQEMEVEVLDRVVDVRKPDADASYWSGEKCERCQA